MRSSNPTTRHIERAEIRHDKFFSAHARCVIHVFVNVSSCVFVLPSCVRKTRPWPDGVDSAWTPQHYATSKLKQFSKNYVYHQLYSIFRYLFVLNTSMVVLSRVFGGKQSILAPKLTRSGEGGGATPAGLDEKRMYQTLLFPGSSQIMFFICISEMYPMVSPTGLLVLVVRLVFGDGCAEFDPVGCQANPSICGNEVLAVYTCPVTCNKCRKYHSFNRLSLNN